MLVAFLAISLTKQSWNETDAIQFVRRTLSREFRGGRHEIAKICHMIGRTGFNLSRPPGDERHANTTIIQVALEAPQRAVGIKEIGVLTAFFVGAVIRCK